MDLKKEINYYVMIINMIAKKYNMKIGEAYKYLNQYEGIKFLHEFYDVEHTLNTEDVLDDLITICGKNGGALQ